MEDESKKRSAKVKSGHRASSTGSRQVIFNARRGSGTNKLHLRLLLGLGGVGIHNEVFLRVVGPTLHRFAALLQFLLDTLRVCQRPVETVPFRAGKLLCEFEVDGCPMAPELLGKWAVVFDEITRRVHEERTLDLPKRYFSDGKHS